MPKEPYLKGFFTVPRSATILLGVHLSLVFSSPLFLFIFTQKGKQKNHRTLMGNSSQAPRRGCLRQIVQMCRSQGSEADWSAPWVSRPLGVRPAAPPLPNLSDPALFLDFFAQTLEYAAFPHRSKHHMALGSDIGTKGQAWMWICEQITESATHPEWIHRGLIDQLGILFADLFQKIGDCRLPPRIGPAAATQLFSCWNAIADLRIQENGWALSSSDPALEENVEIVSRSVRGARVP